MNFNHFIESDGKTFFPSDSKFKHMMENIAPAHYNSALIIDPENTDLFICSKMFMFRNVVKDIYTRKTITGAINFIARSKAPLDLVIIDFLSKDEKGLMEFLQRFDQLPKEKARNTKIFVLSALLDCYQERVNEVLKYKNVVTLMNKPMNDPNIQTIVSFKDAVRLV